MCCLQTGFDHGRLQLTSHQLIWKDYKSQVCYSYFVIQVSDFICDEDVNH